MFKFQKFTLPSSIMLHYHTNATVSNEKILSIEKQEQRERSLSPDSLEQRLYKNQILFEDNDDEEEESILSSSPSLIDSINFDQLHSPQRYQNNSTKTILKTLTSHGFLNTISFLNNNDNEDDMDDIDEIHIDQDEVNLLFSDADDGIIRRLANEFLDIDDDYDETEDFSRHIRPLGLINSSHNQNHDQHLQQQQQQQYIPYHLLDPISEAASEEERRAAISLIRQQQDQQKHKHSTSSSLSLSANGHPDDDTTTNDDLSTLSDMDEQNTSMDENSISQTCSLDNEQHLHKKRRHRDHNSSIHWSTMIGTIDTSGGPDDTLERLRNITKMFSSKAKDEEEPQLKKVEKFEPGEKIKNTFKKFEEAGSSNGVQNDEEEEEEDQPDESDGIVRSRRKKKTQVDPLPYHEIAGVKDKFEKGLMDSDKPRGEKQLDVTVQSGSASAKKQAFEQNQVENEPNLTKTVVVDRDALAGAATEQKAKFEKGEFDHDYHDFGSNRVQADANLLVGAASERKAKFESGQVSDRATTPTRRDEIASLVETGHAQAKRSEILSKIESEQQVLRSGDRHIDIDTEQGLASTRREQLASLAQTEFKSNDKHIDVTTGLASTIKEQYIADTNKASTTKMVPAVSVESGLTKSRTTAFENPDETQIKRTVEIDNEILDRHVAKDRVAMFKNLESGAQSTAAGGADSKIRVDRVEFSDTLVNMSVRLKIKSTDTDKNIVSNTSGEENGNVVRESDKREEIHFEKGQTKQLVEQWKTKQLSPDRDTPDAQILRDAEILQHGKAKNLVEMWKTMDKENSPPAERRGPRPITPPADNQRHLPTADDDESTPRKPSYSDDKANIESGHAKAVRERLMQTAEQANAVNTKKTIRQITPPPNDVRNRQLGTETETTDSSSITEQYENNEEIVPTKGQAQSLKNRFAEFEKDALKVETSSSKIKHTPKRFVDTPAPKPASVEPAVDPTKCSVCQKTVYAMEKIEADKKIYHKSCFKCMHCKSILKLGNYTANDGQIYCKPHFLQLFAIKGNYSAGFGLNDHKARWLPNSSSSASSSSPSSSISNTQESSSFNEN